MTAATATLRPVGVGERTVLLDVLRGFALLGIVLVNFQGSVGTTMPRIDGLTERVVPSGAMEAMSVGAVAMTCPMYSFSARKSFSARLRSMYCPIWLPIALADESSSAS